MTTQEVIDVKEKIRSIQDLQKEGSIFRDITTALKDAETLPVMVDYLCEQFKDTKIDYIAGIESRGFIFGMPMAYKMKAGFVPIRKPNKLPVFFRGGRSMMFSSAGSMPRAMAGRESVTRFTHKS